MRNTIDMATTKVVVWMDGALSDARQRRGEVSLEWILIAAALALVIFAAFGFLGGSISQWIHDLVDKINP